MAVPKLGRVTLDQYKNERPHRGKFCNGKTPMQTFLDAKHLAAEKMIETAYSGLERPRF